MHLGPFSTSKESRPLYYASPAHNVKTQLAGVSAGTTITVSVLVFPASPVAPASPVFPVAPASPVLPVAPASPVAPVAPSAPAGPAGPGTATGTGTVTTVAGAGGSVLLQAPIARAISTDDSIIEYFMRIPFPFVSETRTPRKIRGQRESPAEVTHDWPGRPFAGTQRPGILSRAHRPSATCSGRHRRKSSYRPDRRNSAARRSFPRTPCLRRCACIQTECCG